MVRVLVLLLILLLVPLLVALLVPLPILGLFLQLASPSSFSRAGWTILLWGWALLLRDLVYLDMDFGPVVLLMALEVAVFEILVFEFLVFELLGFERVFFEC